MALKLSVENIGGGERIPPQYAFGVPGDDEPMVLGPNRNPAVSWEGAPEGTKSLVLLCVDPDAPTVADDVNVSGRVVSRDLPRADFYHWVLVDIAPDLPGIAEGAVSDGVTRGGKDPGGEEHGIAGINGYTDFLASDPEMAGTHHGYDGPCPPWNDELVHHYRFTLYALDVESLGLRGQFTGADTVSAMAGHVLDQADVVGTYTLNPEVS